MYSSKKAQCSCNKIIKWGKENEPVALKAYEAIMKNDHEDLKIIKSALKPSAQHHFLVASTDAKLHVSVMENF